MSNIKLTQYSHGAGCGCKISPGVLESILKTSIPLKKDSKLIVGNDSRDDAAVYDIGGGKGIISTTDFFMPIDDDPHTFGKIAAANAISDIYAMGGKPLMALAVLGWPINILSAKIAQLVLEGGRTICKEAGIVLSGGHSIDSPEPIFGLAVTGIIDLNKLKRNNTAKAGNILYLTKPLGVGILTTALKKGVLKDEHKSMAAGLMIRLNTIGLQFADIGGVTAMTDVTGFGFLGHLTEMCSGSNVSANIDFSKVPVLEGLEQYIEKKCFPGGTFNNWKSYGQDINLKDQSYKYILCDPQTSGGLLIAVDKEVKDEVEKILKANKMPAVSFGKLIEREEKLITVRKTFPKF